MPRSLMIQQRGYLESVLLALGLPPEAITNTMQHVLRSTPALEVPHITRVDIYLKSGGTAEMELNLFNDDAPVSVTSQAVN